MTIHAANTIKAITSAITIPMLFPPLLRTLYYTRNRKTFRSFRSLLGFANLCDNRRWILSKWSFLHMKPFKSCSAAILTITSLAAVVAHAVAVPNGAMPGFYLGGQLGYSELFYGKNDFNASSIRINNTVAGGRAYFGYQLNHY